MFLWWNFHDWQGYPREWFYFCSLERKKKVGKKRMKKNKILVVLLQIIFIVCPCFIREFEIHMCNTDIKKCPTLSLVFSNYSIMFTLQIMGTLS